MRFDEYRKYDAVALAALVAKGDVTAGELLDTRHRSRRASQSCDQCNRAHPVPARTRRRRRPSFQVDRCVAFPTCIKDLSIFEKDVPAGLGSALYVNFVPGSRQRLYRALQAGGARYHGPQYDAGAGT